MLTGEVTIGRLTANLTKMDSWVAQILLAFQSKYDVITVAGSVGLKIPKRFLPSHT
jgi:hypothetical protein